MIPARFEYHRAGSLDEALGLLSRLEDAKLLAGGHSLLPMMKLRLAQPAHLIDIGQIRELREIDLSGDSIRVGALVTHASLASSDILRRHAPLVAEAAAKIGDPQVRNKGTVGGNLAHADPASDLPAVLLAAGATIHIRGAEGSRTVPAREFFVDLLTTAVGEDEVLVAVELPAAGSGSGSCYLKVEHPASGYALCGAAAMLTLGGDGAVLGASLAFNGVTAVPLGAPEVAQALVGGGADDAAIDAAVDGHLRIEDPLSDVQASGDYRRHLAAVYAKRALKAARDRARG